MQHATALGVALLGHPLLALTVMAKLLGTLALGADQAFLSLTVDAVRDIAAAVVATRHLDLPAPRLGSGDVAPRRFDALALLAFALLALHLVALRLAATRIVALRQLQAPCFAAGLAPRRLRSLRLLAPLRFGAVALLSVPDCLPALRLFPLRRLLPSCALALRRLELLASRALALAFGLRLLAGALLPRIVLSWCGRVALASRLLARLALARLRDGALRLARLRLRPVCGFAPVRRFSAARLLVALRALFAALAFALLRQRR
ncbi:MULTISPECIES: hypothetical protein [unclassified Luteimonas]